MLSVGKLLIVTLVTICLIAESQACCRRWWCCSNDDHDHIVKRSIPDGCSEFDYVPKIPGYQITDEEKPVTRVFVHYTTAGTCSKPSENTKDKLQNLKTKDFDDAGYNFLIGSDGVVYEGRGWDAVGAHTYGLNKNSIGIAFIGNYVDSLPSKSALITLSKFIQCAGNMAKLSDDYKIYGHRDGVCFEDSKDVLYTYVQSMPKYGGRLVDC